VTSDDLISTAITERFCQAALNQLTRSRPIILGMDGFSGYIEHDLLGRCQQIKPALIVPTAVDYVCKEKFAD
jgi:hypothetical protein